MLNGSQTDDSFSYDTSPKQREWKAYISNTSDEVRSSMHMHQTLDVLTMAYRRLGNPCPSPRYASVLDLTFREIMPVITLLVSLKEHATGISLREGVEKKIAILLFYPRNSISGHPGSW
jgi:hypothetical protein